MANEMRKKIKILSRGMVLTSRGMARTPIDRPYLETISSILIMITRYKADVVEVLPGGKEVKLTINNFNCDNTIVEEVEVSKEPVKPEEVPTQPAISKNMSRKERKRLEAERRRLEQENAAKEEAPVEAESTKEEIQSTKDEVIDSQTEVEKPVEESVNPDNTQVEQSVDESDDVVEETEGADIENGIGDELPEVPVE